MDNKEKAQKLIEQSEELAKTDLRASLNKLREALVVDPSIPDLEDEIFIREDAINKLDSVLDFIVALMRDGKDFKACQMLKDLPDNYIIHDKSGLVSGLQDKVTRVEGLLKRASEVPKSKSSQAVAMLEEALKILPDYPGLQDELDNIKNTTGQYNIYLASIVEAVKKGDISKAKKLFNKFKAVHPSDPNVAKCEVLIRNKEKEKELERYVRIGFIKRVAVLVLVLLVVGGYCFYEMKTISSASKQWKEVSRLLAEKKFIETREGCLEIINKANRVRLLFQEKKQELLTNVDQVLKSEMVVKGAEGKVMFEGDYIPKEFLSKAVVVKGMLKDAEEMVAEGSFTTALRQYDAALLETDKLDPVLSKKIREGIERSIYDVHVATIKDTISKAQALQKTGSFDSAARQVNMALASAKEHGIRSSDPLMVEVTRLQNRILKNKLSDLVASGDKLFKSGNYTVAIEAYKQALSYASANSLDSRSLTIKLNELIDKSKVNALLVVGKQYAEKGNLSDAIKYYKGGLSLAKETGLEDLYLVQEAREDLSNVEVMRVHSSLTAKEKRAQAHMKSNEWEKAKGVFAEAINEASRSKFSSNKRISALVTNLKAGFADADERIYIDSKKEFLNSRYGSIIKRAFGMSGEMSFLNPEIILLTNSPAELKFSITAMSYSKQRGKEEYGRYELTYLLNRGTDRWSVVSKSKSTK